MQKLNNILILILLNYITWFYWHYLLKFQILSKLYYGLLPVKSCYLKYLFKLFSHAFLVELHSNLKVNINVLNWLNCFFTSLLTHDCLLKCYYETSQKVEKLLKALAVEFAYIEKKIEIWKEGNTEQYLWWSYKKVNRHQIPWKIVMRDDYGNFINIWKRRVLNSRLNILNYIV